MVYEDGKCAGSNASGAASKLINMDKVAAILGGACSGETMAFTKMAEQANMPTLSYCSSNPAITTAGDYIFRDYPSDTYQGVLAADYLYNNLAVKKVVVVYSKIDWAYGIKDVFSANFVKLGGQILSEEGFDPETKDFKTILLKAKSQTPEAIYYLAMTDQTITGLRQAKDLGLKTIFFGGDAWQDSKIWTTVGSAGEGAMYLVPSNMAGDAFKLAMAAKVGNDELGPCSPSAYDGVYILAQVMAKVGIDPAAIKNELYKTVYTGGVSAEKIQFDQNGDLVGAKYAVKKVQNGVAAEVK